MESDDEIEESSKWEGNPGTIILINALEDSSTITLAHEATSLLIRQYLRTSSSLNIGVTLYATEHTKTDFNTNNVVDILPMDSPNLEGYKTLCATNIESYGKAGELILSDVLWHCSKIFKDCKKKLSSKTIIILTKLHNPPIESDQIKTKTRVKILVGSGTKITFINISLNDYPINDFYTDLLIDVYKTKDYPLPKAVCDSKVIQNMIHQYSHRHLAVAKLCFEIGDGFSISVGVYSLLHKSGQSHYKTFKIDKKTSEIVTSVTIRTKKTIDSENITHTDSDDSDENVMKEDRILDSELLFCQEFGGERIEFTKKEKEEIYNPFGPRMMKLLGFKPAKILCKEKWFLKTGYFLFPSESIIQGSTIAFRALHKACEEKKTVAICILCTRANARPTIVALVPCTKPLDLDIDIGFNVIHIPFVENIREIPNFEEENQPITEKKQKDEMKKIIQNLRFDYNASMFENPKLQSHYRAIEAKALQANDLENFVDTTIQEREKYKNIQADVFEELFGPFGMLSIKRTGTTESATINKKVRKEDDIDDDILQERISSKTVEKFTVAQLKNLLKSRNISILKNMKKDDLVELVYKHCKSPSSS